MRIYGQRLRTFLRNQTHPAHNKVVITLRTNVASNPPYQTSTFLFRAVNMEDKEAISPFQNGRTRVALYPISRSKKLCLSQTTTDATVDGELVPICFGRHCTYGRGRVNSVARSFLQLRNVTYFELSQIPLEISDFK